MSEKVCERCTATAKNGSRCRNRTCRGDKCWQHLKRDSGLRVRPSQIQGADARGLRTRNFSRGNCMHDAGDAREECMWRCAESDCMNARVRNFRAKFCAKFRENRTFRIRTLYRLREIRTLWHTAQDTLVPGPGHYGARHSLRVSGAASLSIMPGFRGVTPGIRRPYARCHSGAGRRARHPIPKLISTHTHTHTAAYTYSYTRASRRTPPAAAPAGRANMERSTRLRNLYTTATSPSERW